MRATVRYRAGTLIAENLTKNKNTTDKPPVIRSMAGRLMAEKPMPDRSMIA